MRCGKRGPFSIDPQQRTYAILNYESFQQDSWSDEMVAELLKHPLGCIVLDEIQSVRLRDGSEESNRGRRVRALVDGATTRNLAARWCVRRSLDDLTS